MLKNGSNMGIGDKVILSAVIGGTAEALRAGSLPAAAIAKEGLPMVL
jgi:hypothetical protein